MAQVTSLGHVGVKVIDLERELAFYTSVLGLHVADRSDRIAFLSAQPRDQEHHELVLSLGRTPDQTSTVSQVSFHAPTLQDVRDFHARAKAAGATIRSTVSHGNAIGCYFLDPEGNPVEVYYATGIDWPQPFGVPVDLERDSDEAILTAHLAQAPAAAGA